MKLWQKIFLSSLALIILAVNGVSLILLGNNHKLLTERERSHAVNEHEFISNTFINNVIYEKLVKNSVSLSINEISDIADSLISSNQSISSAIYNKNKISTASNITPEFNKLLHEKFIESIDPNSGEYSIIILDCEGKKLIVVGSAINIENNIYYLVTASDISEIYILKDKQADFVRKTSIIISAVISLFLLIMVIALLRPLNVLNSYTKAIAGGKYNIRIKKRGSREFRELADNMNIMADSIQIHAIHLEKIAESRQTFIANLAHEMKTPLTSILGFGDLLRIKKNVTDIERAEYASVIVDETKRLRSLSGKLMALVSIGGTEIEKRKVSLKKLLSETETALVPLLSKNKVKLNWTSDNIFFSADEELFKSLIYNIIENAVKASPIDSEIELTAKFCDGQGIISITDHGIGMKAEEVQRVFEPFYMADKSRSRKAGGTGLGLALCKEIAKLHNSKLDIESAPNKGTTVRIIISEAEYET